ncbi:CCAAT/enhancer-binding protein zeta [Anthonomus grandis grandis]|uniref:CCAAT/enhancer-binding protein zeta n=1 Tax=Anthonomus grandis grandis TaxID=2921223 RepID=UPI002166AB51|nr:CCAAT/enhancer-binding protein zeta [Anthonomus grandis grandis]
MKFNKKNKFRPAKTPEVEPDDDDLEEQYQETPKWYEDNIEEPKSFENVTEQVLIELKDEAKKCHDAEVANYNIKNSKTNSNYQWMKTVMNSGTVSDKIAAHTVAIQDNPVCNLETLTNLVNMVKVGKKKECFTVMETLTELFLSDLLKPDRKLQPFHSKPLSALNDISSGNAIKRRKILSCWYFEDQLKEVYTNFVLALNKAAQDTVDTNKEKAITAMFKLLSGNPEQEKNLLSYLINKLGDPSQKVASKTIYCLTQLLFKHPNMQSVVLKEIEKLLFRPNVNTRAQYYCLCFLSQFYLSHETSDVAKKMIEIYLSFFKACVKKGEVDSRMMSALLMGINRAYPYSKMEFEDMSPHVDTLYRLVHLASFNIALQVLMLLYHVTGEKMADRYYSALYRKLADPKLLTTTHQAMLLSLLYKSLLKDEQINRIKMFIKRLLQVSLFVQPSFSCGILYLVSKLITKKPDCQALTLKELNLPELDKFDDGEEKYFDIKDEKEDWELEVQKEETTDQSTENNVVDETIEIKEEEDVKPDLQEISFKGSSWVHTSKIDKKPILKYNPLARNPLYGGGEFLAYSELRYFRRHFHPTVALWTEELLKGEKLKYSGDPLKDFTLIRFLDRFVFKNPKTMEDKTGAHPTFGKRKFYRPKGVKMLSVNSKSYLNEDEKNIPVDELFLYSFLQKKYQNRKLIEDDDDNSDLESVQSEEFEEMLDKMAGLKDDESDEEIDFMGEIGDNLKKKPEKQKKKRKGEEEEEGTEDEGSLGELEEDEDGLDDEEPELSDDGNEEMEEDGDDGLEATEEDLDLFDGLSDDDEDEDLVFPSDSEEEKNPKKNLKKALKTKAKKDDMSSVFASAEEFATLLDEEGSSKQKPGTSNVMDNRDKASQKQLAWEDKRNRWIKGYNKAVKDKGGNFSNKRPNKSKFSSKSKKLKKR